jgi:hypothetical protein
MEFRPVTFAAYAGATAGVRSLTDWYMRRRDLAGACSRGLGSANFAFGSLLVTARLDRSGTVKPLSVLD